MSARHVKIMATVVLFSLSSCALAAQAYRVVKIADGDTLTALSADLRQLKCRLYGIDAPDTSKFTINGQWN